MSTETKLILTLAIVAMAGMCTMIAVGFVRIAQGAL